MKAIGIVRESELELKEIAQPQDPPEGHLLVQMAACTINPGDKYFLSNPAARALMSGNREIWGASGAGRVVAVGTNVPSHYSGKRVAIYRSLARTEETIGLWSEVAQVHHTSCVVLPDNLNIEEYSGSLVNIMTAYAFLPQIKKDGHDGVVVTAANSATGRALLELARIKKVRAIGIVRSQSAREECKQLGFENILNSTDASFVDEFQALAAKHHTTAVFEGVGGDIVTCIAPILPVASTFYFYGFLAGAATFSAQSRILLERNILMRGFSNFMTETVQNQKLLSDALDDLSTIIERPVFRTKVGKRFSPEQIDEAMKFQGTQGAKSVLQFSEA